MDETLFTGSENWMDRLLHDLGNRGVLDMELDEDDLDRLLAAACPVSLSASFDRRARLAIRDAQIKREERDPALALGIVVARARSRAGLGLAEAALHAGVSVKSLESLETGRLSIRQILRGFPPAVAAQLLTAIELAAHEYTTRLMDLAALGERAPMRARARITDHPRQRDNAALAMEAADYVAALHHIAQSKESSEP